MLTVDYTEDVMLLKKLYADLNIGGEIAGINAVLSDDGEPAGLCRMKLTERGVKITDFGLVGGKEQPHYADFFFRTVLFKLSRASLTVIVGRVDDRLKKFGFRQVEGFMEVEPHEIKFLSDCGHNS